MNKDKLLAIMDCFDGEIDKAWNRANKHCEHKIVCRNAIEDVECKWRHIKEKIMECLEKQPTKLKS